VCVYVLTFTVVHSLCCVHVKVGSSLFSERRWEWEQTFCGTDSVLPCA